jgi:acetyl-CoA C-acetyltransferase
MNTRSPAVLAGVAHLRSNPERDPAAGREPLDLLAEAARAAARDAGLPDVLTQLDGVSVVHQLTWNYDDLPGDLAWALGSPDARTEIGRVGGDTPLPLLAAAADRVSRGKSRAELVCAAEALSSLKEALSAGVDPGWSERPGGRFVVPDDWRGAPRMRRLDLDWPVRVYPLFENALRGRLGQSFAEAQAWTGRIYEEFSAVSTTVEAAWNPGQLEAAAVVRVGPGNRMICWPYPMRVNSLLMVDQAAAVLVVSPELARSTKPAVYLLGTVAGADSTDILARPSLAESAALRGVLEGVLADTGTKADDLVAVDLYSCFPVVPKLAALVLGIEDGRPLTTTGGMNAFGGAGSGYSLHGVVTTVQVLREKSGRALVHANGEYLTKEATAVLGTDAAPPTWRELPPPEPGPVVSDGPAPGAEENITVETYTVEFGRDGAPARGWVIGRTAASVRSAGIATDPAVLGELTDPDREPIGRPGVLSAADQDAAPMFRFHREDT